jgi:eukaryotic-like serine/threonine-protein kinase
MSTPRHGTYFYQFGPFEVDVTNRQLLREGNPVPLAPKVLDALFVLIENSGRVLKKEDLMNSLWSDCFVEESSLTQIIFQLRKALGESAAKQQYIETIPKRGYRFIAEIKMVNGDFDQRFTHLIGTKEILQTNEERIDHDSRVNGKEALLAVNQEPVSLAPGPQPSVDLSPVQTEQHATRHRWKTVAIAAGVLLAVPILIYIIISQLIGRLNAPIKKAPQIRKLTSSGNAQMPALSPDGNYLAYIVDEGGRQSIRVRQMNSTSEALAVPPAEVTYRGMTFSPDGSFINYVVLGKDQWNGTLYQVPVLGGTPRKILPWVDSVITFSPDGKRFAFVRITDEQKESFLMTANADGSGEQRLAARRRPEIFSIRGPAWSPDGKTIASVAGRRSPGDSYMYIVNVDVANGSESRLGSQTWNLIESAAWLKDGSGVIISAWHQESPVFANQIWRLAYPNGDVIKITDDLGSYARTSTANHDDILATGRSERISRLWVAPNGDGKRARLIRTGYGDNYSELFGLCWTPDGRLVYGSHASGNADIWVMDADGGNQKQLTFNSRRDVLPAVSSDGDVIVFVSKGSGSSYIWRMDSDGRNPRQLTNGKGDDSPSISPDGRWVVFSSFDESGKLTLWKVSIDGGEPMQLTHYTAYRPVVAPDGKLIACQIQDEQTKRTAVAILSFEGGAPIRRFNDMQTPDHELIRWTPDGRSLTYIVTKDGVSNIWLQPVEGGRPKQLTNFKEDQIFRLAWSNDGKNLAFDRGVTIKNILLISDFR